MASPFAQDFSVVAAAPYQRTPLGCAQLTLSSTLGLKSAVNAAGTTFAVPTAARVAVLTVETANVRWCDDGQTPTTTFGNLLLAGQSLEYVGDLNAIQFAAVSGTPVIDVSYYK